MRALAAHAPAGTQVVVVANDPSEAQAAALAGLDARDERCRRPGSGRRGRLDGDPPGLGRGPQRGHPPRGRAGGDPPGHERGARGRPRHGAGHRARGPDGRRRRTVRPRVQRHAPVRGGPGRAPATSTPSRATPWRSGAPTT